MKTSLKKISLLTSLIVLAFAFLLLSCDKDESPGIPDPETGTIPEVATETPQISTFVSAITKAELVDTLESTGPFTVFAPSNEAFVEAGLINLDSLNADALKPIMASHVVPGEMKAADIQSGAKATANTSNNIYFSKNTEGVFINGTIKVISSDVDASNGVIHIVDGVITPPAKSLTELVADDTNFTELLSLIAAADTSVTNALAAASQNGLTIFAPVNAAFTALYQTTPKDSLLAPANKEMLAGILLYHIVPGRVFSTDLPNASGEVSTANPEATITFVLEGGTKVVGATSGESNVTSANILATNGVIHVIDKVLLP